MYLLLVLESQPHLSALSHTRAGELGNNSSSLENGKLCKNVCVWQTLSTPNIPILEYLILRIFDPQIIGKDLLLSHRQHSEMSVSAFQSLVDTGACSKGVREMQLERNSVMSCLPQ